jgi:hypothetical protein
MLQRMQAKVGKFFRFGVGVDRNHTALVMEFVGTH